MQIKKFAALAACASVASAAIKGFNYGNYNPDGTVADYNSFLKQFKAAKNLVGAKDFTAARLYTMIEAGQTDTLIPAVDAAMASGTKLLLGIWGSAGDAAVKKEIQVLKKAIKDKGKKFSNLVVGISVGSEDLYRETPIGIKNNAGVGASPTAIAKYIHQVKAALKGTHLAHTRVGHVDTWTAWVNKSNHAVVQAADFLGVDAYPYYESTKSNPVSKSLKIFDSAMEKVNKVAGKKAVWITETGWPTAGPKSGQAVASVANAHAYWHKVSCKWQAKGVPLFWYTLYDHGADGPEFGVVGPKLSSKPKFDLSCPSSSKSEHKAKAHHGGVLGPVDHKVPHVEVGNLGLLDHKVPDDGIIA